METVLDVLHVLSAVFLVGPMAVLPMVAMRDLRAGNGAQVGTLARSTFVFSVASLVVVVFGFGVLGGSDPKYHLTVGTPWILASLICYLVALAVTLGVVVPAMRQAAERVVPAVGAVVGARAGEADRIGAGEGAAGDTGMRPSSAPAAASGAGDYQRIAMSSGVASLLLVVVVVLMVWKP